MIKPSIIKPNYKLYDSQIESYKTRISNLEENIEAHQHLILSLIKSQNLNSSNDSTISLSPKQFKTQIQENLSLSKEIESSNKELTLAQSRSFLSEQIHYDLSQKLKEISFEYVEKLSELNFSFNIKTKVIDELQVHNKKLSDRAAFYLLRKFTEVSPPTEDILKIHSQVERMQEKIQELTRNFSEAIEFKATLTQFVNKISTAQQMVQALLQNPINRKTGAERVFFKQIEELEDSEDSEDSSESSELEIIESSRSARVSKLSTLNPTIDFPKTSRHSVPEQSLPIPIITLPQSLKELKSLYTNLDSLISTRSSELEALSKENSKYQQENVVLTQKLLSSPRKFPKTLPVIAEESN